MHSDLEQAERDDILYKFKSGQIDVLVATDIVARGIDIDDIAMVINFDVPHDPEDYVHRIGRTARAQRDGIAITFVAEDEINSFKQIEKFLEREVEKIPLPEGLGEAPDYNAPAGKGRSRNSRSRSSKEGNSNRNGRGHKRGEGRNNRNSKKAESGNPEKNENSENTKQSLSGTQEVNAAQDSLVATQTQGQQQAQQGLQPSSDKPKRKRKPRHKQAAETESDAQATNNQQTARKPRQNKQKQDGKTDEKRQDSRPKATAQNTNRPKRRNGNNRQPGNRQSKDAANVPEQKISVPAPKQPSTITKILKSPISWIKSLGKKND